MKYLGYGKQIQGETFYTVHELGEILRVQAGEIDSYINAGELLSQKINKTRMISAAALEAFLKTHSFPAMWIGGDS